MSPKTDLSPILRRWWLYAALGVIAVTLLLLSAGKIAFRTPANLSGSA